MFAPILGEGSHSPRIFPSTQIHAFSSKMTNPRPRSILNVARFLDSSAVTPLLRVSTPKEPYLRFCLGLSRVSTFFRQERETVSKNSAFQRRSHTLKCNLNYNLESRGRNDCSMFYGTLCSRAGCTLRAFLLIEPER